MLHLTRMTGIVKSIPNPRARSTRQGAAMLELAIVLPILLMLLLGIIEMGRVMMLNQVATNAGREGVRRAIIAGASEGNIRQIVQDYLQNAGVSGDGMEILITDINGQPAALSSISSHQPVTVTVRLPYASNTWGFTRIMGQNTLETRATMRRE